jgi:hypothetical membrane protein
MTTRSAPEFGMVRPIRPTAAAGADLRLAGILLWALAAQFMTVIMVAASMAPAYDLAGGAISDLGVIPETALLFNTSLLAVGMLNVLAGYALHSAFRRAWILPTFVVAGIGAIGAGLVPLDRGGLHGLLALVAFVAFNAQALACGRLVTGPLRAISIGSGLVGLAFVVLMVVGDSGLTAAFGPIGHGGAERMIVYPAMLWMLAFGGYFMAGEPRTS